MKAISISRIVAATDFSAGGELAVRRGALIAKHLDAELHLMHVVHPLDLYPGLMVSFGSGQNELERLREESGNNRLGALAATLEKDYGVAAKTITRIGHAHTQIVDYAAVDPASLVVVGARGENTLLDLLLGSTASRLMNIATCPVLIVRNTKIESYQQAIAAVDFSQGCDTVPLLARTVAPEAHIEVLHVFDLVQEARMRDVGLDDIRLQQYRDEALNQVKSLLDKMLTELQDDRMTREALTGYPPAEICARATELHSDLIVLGRQGKSGIQEFLVGTVSKDVASAAECDVLLAY